MGPAIVGCLSVYAVMSSLVTDEHSVEIKDGPIMASSNASCFLECEDSSVNEFDLHSFAFPSLTLSDFQDCTEQGGHNQARLACGVSSRRSESVLSSV